MTSRSRPPKSAMLVAERIVQDALREGIGPGDALPLEKSMLLRYAIGRGTLREALRLLEFQGVILLKPGMHAKPAELSSYLQSQFAKWQLPDAYEFIAEIPRTSTGKFWKAKLRERYRK